MRLLALLCIMAMTSGCAMFHRPETSIGYNWFWGMRFSDTKDNDVSIDLMEIDKATKTLHIENLKIRNNASDPIVAFTQQQQKLVELHAQLGDNLSKALETLIGLINQQVNSPGVTITDVP